MGKFDNLPMLLLGIGSFGVKCEFSYGDPRLAGGSRRSGNPARSDVGHVALLAHVAGCFAMLLDLLFSALAACCLFRAFALLPPLLLVFARVLALHGHVTI